MKRFLAVFILLLSISFGAHAVLKENGIGRTLSVLRAELKYACEQQQRQMEAYELQVEKLHQQLIGYMTRSEQVGLMLYSNNMNNSFSVAYSCSEAEKLREKLEGEHGDMASYAHARTLTSMDIEKYRSLIRTLKNIPPVETEDEDESDISVALDSLRVHLSESYDGVSETSLNLVSLMKGYVPEQKNEPLVLTGQMLEDRAACVEYAQIILANLEKYKASLEKDNVYYEGVKSKVEELHDFADSCYVMLQNHIYYSFDNNPLNLIMNIGETKEALVNSWHDDFKDFQELQDENEELSSERGDISDWRGSDMLSLSVLFILYFFIARLLVSFVLGLIYKAKLKNDGEYRHKLYVLKNIITYVLMMLVAYVLYFINGRSNHMVEHSMPLLVNYLWLALAVMLSLYSRLEGRKLEEMAKTFAPFLDLSFLVAIIRMTLSPDIWINVIFPPAVLICALVTLRRSIRYRHDMEVFDSVLIWLTTAQVLFSTFLAMTGASLYSLLEVYWWCLQIGCIMTIRWVRTIVESKSRGVQQYEWLNVFFNKCVVPILFICSIPFCLYRSADVFAIGSYCDEMFNANFIDEAGLMQVSLMKIFKVTIMWFIFRYIANVIRWIYEKLNKTVRKGEKANANDALLQNGLSIIVWGLYFVTALVILNVPRSGISIVSAGLATGLGFAMKGLIENFVCGIYLMTGRLRVGDNIECDGVEGSVQSISYQNTQIATYDGCIVSFQNTALFNKNFKNLTRNHNFVRETVKVGVAYGSDVALVRDVIQKAIQEVGEMPGANGKALCDFKRFPASVLFVDFGDSSLDFEVRAWTRIADRVRLKTELRKAIYEAFEQNNISIPFPQRDIHVIKDLEN
ncbi:MAG: mechanosensitive ion channel [Bacteroidales bacterium]|nr:mechanosensitive ion channel [Candidatus Cryptobacteroides equifaecalis]